MAYEFITSYDSPNYWPGRPQGIDAITIHWWGDPATRPSFWGVVNWLCDTRSGVSAHYVAEAGRVACIVHPGNQAWHAMGGNATTIGIECNPRMSDADLETVAELIADIRRRYGNLPLRPHAYYVNTACPGTYAGKLGWLDGRARQIQNSTTQTLAPAPVPVQLPKGTKMILIELPNYGNGHWKRDTQSLYALAAPQFFLRFTGKATAEKFAKQLGGPPVVVEAAFWDDIARASMHGSNNAGYQGDLHSLAVKAGE